MQRQEATPPPSRSVALEKVTKAGEWMIKNKNILLSAGLLVICGYEIASYVINGRDQTPIENPAILYPWFTEETARLGAIDILCTIAKNSFPTTQSIFKDIALGIAAGMIQFPLAIGTFLIENNIPLNRVKIGLPPNTKETYQTLATVHLSSFLVEFSDRGVYMPCVWSTLVKWGLPSSYAMTGSAVLSSAMSAFSKNEKARFSNFVSGLYLSGLTLFSQGNLIPGTVSESTKNILASFVQVPSQRK